MRIERLGAGDEDAVVAAEGLFDGPAIAEATRRFLANPLHHLLVAYEEGRPAGFVSGVEVTHPDKGTELFLYELAVDPAFQRRGIGAALVAALAELAAEVGSLRGGADGFELVAEVPPGTDCAPWVAAGATWCLTAFGPQPTLAEVRAAIEAGP